MFVRDAVSLLWWASRLRLSLKGVCNLQWMSISWNGDATRKVSGPDIPRCCLESGTFRDSAAGEVTAEIAGGLSDYAATLTYQLVTPSNVLAMVSSVPSANTTI